MFTPPTLEGTAPGEKKGTMYLPGWVGGANWGGAAVDPETGVLYVPSVTFPWLGALIPGTGRFTYTQTRKRLDREPGPGPRGLPITKPPYGRITAIDLNTRRSPLDGAQRRRPARPSGAEGTEPAAARADRAAPRRC